MVGKTVKFVPSENDPLRIFGLPKHLLLEVIGIQFVSNYLPIAILFFDSSSDLPYTVIRQVTKQGLDTLEDASNTSFGSSDETDT